MAVRACSSAFLRTTEQRFHHVTLDIAYSAATSTPPSRQIATCRRAQASASSNRPWRANQKQRANCSLAALPRGPLGALEPRGLVDLGFHLRDVAKRVPCTAAKRQRFEAALVVAELAVQRGRAHGGVVAFAPDRIEAELGDREPEPRRQRCVDVPASTCRRNARPRASPSASWKDDHQTLYDTPSQRHASSLPSGAVSAHSSAARRLSSSAFAASGTVPPVARQRHSSLLERLEQREQACAWRRSVACDLACFRQALERVRARGLQHPVARDRHRLRPAPATCRPARPRWSSAVQGSMRSSLATCCAASSVKPPANTPSRRNTVCSSAVSSAWLHSSVARNVWCRRSTTRAPPVSRLKRSCRRARSPSTPSSGTRAAASSMASGMPSRRRQISITAGRLAALSAKRGSTALRARREELDRAGVHAPRSAVGGGGNRKRAEAIHVLVGGLERFLARDAARSRAARRRSPCRRAPPPRRRDARNCRAPAAARCAASCERRRVGRRAIRRRAAQPHRLRDRRRHERAVGERGELHPPHAVRIVGRALRRDLRSPRPARRASCRCRRRR